MKKTHRVPTRRQTAEHSGLAQKKPKPSFSLNPAGILHQEHIFRAVTPMLYSRSPETSLTPT